MARYPIANHHFGQSPMVQFPNAKSVLLDRISASIAAFRHDGPEMLYLPAAWAKAPAETLPAGTAGSPLAGFRPGITRPASTHSVVCPALDPCARRYDGRCALVLHRARPGRSTRKRARTIAL